VPRATLQITGIKTTATDTFLNTLKGRIAHEITSDKQFYQLGPT
jgi:hypothetical protein